jgi:MSHA biogenesis protein MshK
MARRLSLSLLLVMASSAAAAPFADPTRPPSASATGSEEASSGPRLESVLLSPGRRLAVIDGKEYRAGEAFGDGRILSIAPSGVAIQRGAQTEILRLYPEYRKRVEKNAK